MKVECISVPNLFTHQPSPFPKILIGNLANLCSDAWDDLESITTFNISRWWNQPPKQATALYNIPSPSFFLCNQMYQMQISIRIVSVITLNVGGKSPPKRMKWKCEGCKKLTNVK